MSIFTSKEVKKTRYIEYLKKELNILKNHLDTSRVVTQMHFGGGTPTYFSPQQLERCYKIYKDYFSKF